MHEPFALTGLRRADRELRAVARLSGEGDDLDGAVGDLGRLKGEEPADEVRVGARDGHRGALGSLVDVGDVDPQTGAVLVLLAGHLLVRGQHRFDLAEVDLDHLRVPTLLDGAGDDLSLPPLEGAEQGLVLDIAQTLVDDLARGLRGDASEA